MVWKNRRRIACVRRAVTRALILSAVILPVGGRVGRVLASGAVSAEGLRLPADLVQAAGTLAGEVRAIARILGEQRPAWSARSPAATDPTPQCGPAGADPGWMPCRQS